MTMEEVLKLALEALLEQPVRYGDYEGYGWPRFTIAQAIKRRDAKRAIRQALQQL